MPGPSYSGHDLVFVVGCPRSGTTWVQHLLASHPQVVTGQESDVFDLYVGPQLRTWRRELEDARDGRGGLGMACYLREDEFLEALRTYMLSLLRPMLDALSPGQVFVEKTPSHVIYLPEIVELLPQARVVHVLRDARDVVASLLAASRSWGAGWAPRTAQLAARTWVDHVEAAERYRPLLGDRFVEVRYEDMLVDAKGSLRRIASFLDLDWEEGALAAALLANTAGAEGRTGHARPLVRGGEFARRGNSEVHEPDGFVRRAGSGGWRQDLSRREQLDVWRTARHAMARHGYTWPYPW
jgi:hypothetical protein